MYNIITMKIIILNLKKKNGLGFFTTNMKITKLHSYIEQLFTELKFN